MLADHFPIKLVLQVVAPSNSSNQMLYKYLSSFVSDQLFVYLLHTITRLHLLLEWMFKEDTWRVPFQAKLHGWIFCLLVLLVFQFVSLFLLLFAWEREKCDCKSVIIAVHVAGGWPAVTILLWSFFFFFLQHLHSVLRPCMMVELVRHYCLFIPISHIFHS